MKRILDTPQYAFLFLLLAIPYGIGLFVPLMDSDSAHHANIALHMFKNNNFIDLIDKGKDYLDKPHLLFWLAGASYYIFGVNAFAFKLPSFIMSIAAVFATKKLGDRLYHNDTGNLAALILASAQAFITACNDVRMDALLTSCIILATWQLVEVVHNKKWYNYVLAALFLAMGFSTKGQVGVVMPGVAIFFYLLFRRDFALIFNIRWLAVGLLLVVFMLPELYAFYIQFDKHPEKTIRGMSNISGVKFILWGQNIERLDGTKWGGGKKDYFFYFHTLLWAFLPWSLLAYYALGSRIKRLFQTRFAYFKSEEGLTVGTILCIFILISLSRFQLPHYLNILFPFFSILTAEKLLRVAAIGNQKPIKAIYILQLIIVLILVIGTLILNVWAFPVQNIFLALVGISLLTLLAFTIVKRDVLFVKTIMISVICMVFVNTMLNGNFYRRLIDYQAGTGLAKLAADNNIPMETVAFYNTHSFAFDFDSKNLAPPTTLPGLGEQKNIKWTFTDGNGLDSLRGSNLSIGKIYEHDQFRITRLTPAFLNPNTRAKTLGKLYLVEIRRQ